MYGIAKIYFSCSPYKNQTSRTNTITLDTPKAIEDKCLIIWIWKDYTHTTATIENQFNCLYLLILGTSWALRGIVTSPRLLHRTILQNIIYSITYIIKTQIQIHMPHPGTQAVIQHQILLYNQVIVLYANPKHSLSHMVRALIRNSWARPLDIDKTI